MISGVYKSRATDLIKTIRENGLILILLVIFTSGIIFGTTVIKNNSLVVDRAVSLISDYVTLRGNQSVFECACNSFVSNLLFLIVLYIFGLCAVGLPVIMSAPFIKGAGLGLISAFFYTTYGLNGLGHCILVIYPGAVLSVMFMFLAVKTAIVSSGDIFSSISSRKNHEIRFIEYSKRFFMYFCVNIGFSLLDGVLNKIFSNIFII